MKQNQRSDSAKAKAKHLSVASIIAAPRGCNAQARAAVAGGVQRLTRSRSGLGTNVAAYESHASVCDSPRKTSGNQPLNSNR